MSFLNIFRGLTRTDLSHYYYQQLLGLRKSPNKPADNLDNLAGELHRDSERLQALELQQAIMSRQYYIVRIVYIFFNISNYAFNTYLLAAHDVYKASQNRREGEMMPTLEEGIPEPQERGFMQGLWSLWDYSAQSVSAGIGYYPGLVIRFIQNYFGSNTSEQESVRSTDELALVASVFPAVSEAPSALETASGKQFCVTDGMHGHLEVLGIDRPNGVTLNWADVRAAYRQKALVTHPDKGYLNTEFHVVKEALDRLQALIFDEPQSDAELSAQWDWYFSEIHRRYDNVERMAAENAKLVAEIKEIVAEVKRMNAETVKVVAESIRTEARIIELLRQRDARTTQQVGLSARQDEANSSPMKFAPVRQTNIIWPHTLGMFSMPLCRQVTIAKPRYLIDEQPGSIEAAQAVTPPDERQSISTAFASP